MKKKRRNSARFLAFLIAAVMAFSGMNLSTVTALATETRSATGNESPGTTFDGLNLAGWEADDEDTGDQDDGSVASVSADTENGGSEEQNVKNVSVALKALPDSEETPDEHSVNVKIDNTKEQNAKIRLYFWNTEEGFVKKEDPKTFAKTLNEDVLVKDMDEETQKIEIQNTEKTVLTMVKEKVQDENGEEQELRYLEFEAPAEKKLDFDVTFIIDQESFTETVDAFMTTEIIDYIEDTDVIPDPMELKWEYVEPEVSEEDAAEAAKGIAAMSLEDEEEAIATQAEEPTSIVNIVEGDDPENRDLGSGTFSTYAEDTYYDGTDYWACIAITPKFKHSYVVKLTADNTNGMAMYFYGSKPSKPGSTGSGYLGAMSTTGSSTNYSTSERITVGQTCYLYIKTQKSSRANFTYQITRAAHTFVVSDNVPATCTESGTTYNTCSSCGYRTDGVSEPLGHDIQEIVDQAPTCTEDGVGHGVCSRCGVEAQKVLPATGHTITDTEGEIEKEPTCTSEGVRILTCDVCHEKIKESIQKTPHTFGTDGICTECEATGTPLDALVVHPMNSDADMSGYEVRATYTLKKEDGTSEVYRYDLTPSEDNHYTGYVDLSVLPDDKAGYTVTIHEKGSESAFNGNGFGKGSVREDGKIYVYLPSTLNNGYLSGPYNLTVVAEDSVTGEKISGLDLNLEYEYLLTTYSNFVPGQPLQYEWRGYSTTGYSLKNNGDGTYEATNFGSAPNTKFRANPTNSLLGYSGVVAGSNEVCYGMIPASAKKAARTIHLKLIPQTQFNVEVKNRLTNEALEGVSWALYEDAAAETPVLDSNGNAIAGETDENGRIQRDWTNWNWDNGDTAYVKLTGFGEEFIEYDSSIQPVKVAPHGTSDGTLYLSPYAEEVPLTVTVIDSNITDKDQSVSGRTVEVYEYNPETEDYDTLIGTLTDNEDGTYGGLSLTATTSNMGQFRAIDTETGAVASIDISKEYEEAKATIDISRYDSLLSIVKKDENGEYIGDIDLLYDTGILDSTTVDPTITDPIAHSSTVTAKLYGIAIDETLVQDDVIYTYTLPSELIPILSDDQNGKVGSDWLYLTRFGEVRAYGRIVPDGEDYIFQVYFVNTEGQYEIEFGYEYNASIADQFKDGGDVTVEYLGKELSFQVQESEPAKKLEMKKSVTWVTDYDHTDEKQVPIVGGKTPYNVMKYTIEITNNTADMVSMQLTETFSDGMMMKYNHTGTLADNYPMEVYVDKGNGEYQKVIFNGRYGYYDWGDSSGQYRGQMGLVSSNNPTYKSGPDYEEVTDGCIFTISNASFEKLKLVYYVDTYYSVNQANGIFKTSDYITGNNPTTDYNSISTVNVTYPEMEVVTDYPAEMNATAGKNYATFGASLAMAQYNGCAMYYDDNRKETVNAQTSGSFSVDAAGSKDQTGRIDFKLAGINTGGEGWYMFEEKPWGQDWNSNLPEAASRNYYFNAVDFMPSNGPGGMNSFTNSVRIRLNGTELTNLYATSYAEIQGVDPESYEELKALLKQTPNSNAPRSTGSLELTSGSSLPSYTYYPNEDYMYWYSDGVNYSAYNMGVYRWDGKIPGEGNATRKVWIVVAPETTSAAMWAGRYRCNNYDCPLADAKGMPVGVKFYILGLNGNESIDIEYSKYQRCLSTPAVSTLVGSNGEIFANNDTYSSHMPEFVGSQIYTRNRNYQYYTYAYSNDNGDDMLLYKTSEYLEDGSIKYELTLDANKLVAFYGQVGKSDEYYSGNGVGNNRSLYIFEDLPDGYTFYGGKTYDDKFGRDMYESTNGIYRSGWIYLFKGAYQYDYYDGNDLPAYAYNANVVGSMYNGTKSTKEGSTSSSNSLGNGYGIPNVVTTYDAYGTVPAYYLNNPEFIYYDRTLGKYVMKIMYIATPNGNTVYQLDQYSNTALYSSTELIIPWFYENGSWQKNHLVDAVAATVTSIPYVAGKSMTPGADYNKWHSTIKLNGFSAPYSNYRIRNGINSYYLNGSYALTDNMRDVEVYDSKGNRLNIPNPAKYMKLTDLTYSISFAGAPTIKKTIDLENPDSDITLKKEFLNAQTTSKHNLFDQNMNPMYGFEEYVQTTRYQHNGNGYSRQNSNAYVESSYYAAYNTLRARLAYAPNAFDGTSTVSNLYGGDHYGMDGGFYLTFTGLTNATAITVDYNTVFDYEAFAKDYPQYGIVSLKMVNGAKMNATSMGNSLTPVKSTAQSWSFAVRPDADMTFDKDANVEDYQVSYTGHADVGAVPQDSIYVVGQLSGIKSGETELRLSDEASQEALAAWMDAFEVTDLKIVAKNRIDKKYSSDVYVDGETQEGWTVAAVEPSKVAGVPVPEGAAKLDLNQLYAYQISTSDGTEIPGETYFEVTYKLSLKERAQTEDGEWETYFRQLDSYDGGSIFVENSISICYKSVKDITEDESVTDSDSADSVTEDESAIAVQSDEDVEAPEESGDDVDAGESEGPGATGETEMEWVAANDADNGQLLVPGTLSKGGQFIHAEEDDDKQHNEGIGQMYWTLSKVSKTAGKPEWVNATASDTMYVSALLDAAQAEEGNEGFGDDTLNAAWINLFYKHLKITDWTVTLQDNSADTEKAGTYEMSLAEVKDDGSLVFTCDTVLNEDGSATQVVVKPDAITRNEDGTYSFKQQNGYENVEKNVLNPWGVDCYVQGYYTKAEIAAMIAEGTLSAQTQKYGYGVNHLFDLDYVQMDYQQQVDVRYDMEINWTELFAEADRLNMTEDFIGWFNENKSGLDRDLVKAVEAALKEQESRAATSEKLGLTGDDVLKLGLLDNPRYTSVLNQASDGDNETWGSSGWDYPAVANGTLTKKATINEDGTVDWTVSLTNGDGTLRDLAITDTMTVNMKKSEAVVANSEKALPYIKVTKIAVTDAEGNVLYEGEPGAAELTDAEGVFTGGKVDFTAEDALFTANFASVEAKTTLNITYTTLFDAEEFAKNGGDLSTNIAISNTATGTAVGFEGETGKDIEITPPSDNSVEKESYEYGLLNESGWKVTAKVGSVAANTLTLADTLEVPEDVKPYLSITGMKISVTNGEEETVLYNTEENLDLLAQNHFELKNGEDAYNFTLTFNAAEDKDVTLAADSVITVDYTTAIDEEAYLAAGGTEGYKTLKNVVCFNRNGMSEKSANATDTPGIKKVLSKSGKQAGYQNGKTVTNWTAEILLNKLYTVEELKKAETATIVDTMSDYENMAYVDGSLKLYDMTATGGKGAAISADSYVVEQKGKQIEVTLQNPAEHPMMILELQTLSPAGVSEIANKLSVSILDKKENTESEPVPQNPKKSGYVISKSKTGTVELVKTDSETGDALTDAEFTLYMAACGEYEDHQHTDRCWIVVPCVIKQEAGQYVYDSAYTAANNGASLWENTLTTDDQGRLTVGKLPFGEYKLVETKAPAGYILADAEADRAEEFTIDGSSFTEENPNVVTFHYDWENTPISFQVYKYFEETFGTEEKTGPLGEAKLQIWNADQTQMVAEATTDENGNITFSRLVPGDYVLVETVAPSGFEIAENIAFTVNGNGTIQVADDSKAATDDAGNLYIKMQDDLVRGQIEITKQGEVLKKLNPIKKLGNYIVAAWQWVTGNLENVTFQIYAAEDVKIQNTVVFEKDALVDTITTNASGVAALEDLPAGSYYAVEVVTGDNYILDGTPIPFVLENGFDRNENPVVNTASATITNDRKNVSVSITKTDADTDEALANAVFGLYASEDGIFAKDELVDVVTTDNQGQAEFAADIPAGSYYVVELQAPAGYELDSTHYDIVFDGDTEHEAEFTVEATNKETSVSIGKVDVADGSELPGATIQILDQDGNLVEEWVSEETPHQVKGLHTCETYTLRETVAPNGYEVTADTTFILNADGTLDQATTTTVSEDGVLLVEDTLTSVQIAKVDVTDNSELPGATIQIVQVVDGNEVVVEEWLSGETPHQVTGLTTGVTYILRETVAPDGYAVTTDTTFILNADGTIGDDTTTTVSEDGILLVEDHLTEVTISKVDTADGSAVAGATLQILDETGEVVDEWTSDETAHTVTGLLPGKEYTLHEAAAPEGYTLAADRVFVLKTDGTILKKDTTATIAKDGGLLVEDAKTSVKVSKVDVTDGAELAGAHIQIIQIVDEKEVVVEEWDSTTKPHEVTGLPAGAEYILRETVAPTGYEVTTDTTFVLNADGSIGSATTTTVSDEGILLVEDDVTRTSIAGTKTWNDNNNQDGVRPLSITVNLIADGKQVDSKVVTAADGWTYSFDNIPQYAKGKEIVYRITEEAVTGYVSEVSGYDLVNTHYVEKTDISGSKTWDDNDNQDGKRPESITINLLADGEVADSKVVTAADEWSWSFTGLDKYSSMGKEIVYTITEDEVEDYSTVVTGYDVTNSYTPGKTAVSGSKTWLDNDDQDKIRPESVTIRLYANGKEVSSKVVTAEDNWNYSFTDLDLMQNGKEIEYTILEDAVDGYDTVVTGYNVTNTHKPETTEISGSKTWADNNDQDGIRPENITINLLADGKVVDSKVVTAADNWSWSFTDLDKYADGKEIVYTIEEKEVPGYQTKVDGYNVTNTHNSQKTAVSGSKTWADANNQDGKRPTSITVNLYAGTELVTSKEIKADADGNWTYEFKDLDKYADGKEIVYKVTEDPVAEYSTTYNGFDITNTYTPGKTAVSGSKIWNDNNNQDGKRPQSITVVLLANGQVADSKEVTAADNWSWSFENLDQYKDGKEIKYSIEEISIDGYKSEIKGYNIENTYAPEKTSVSGIKTWSDNNDQDGIRPDSVVINLLANGTKVASQVVSAAKDWTYEFKDLDKYADGKEIVYTITESSVPGYTADISGYDVTNNHTPETVSVSGSKTWYDNDNQDGKRPESIVINLLADGKKVDSKVVTEADGWSYSFTNLAKYANGELIAYTIAEDEVSEYTSKVSGYNVSNTYTPEKTEVTGSKTWADHNDQDGKRPESIVINLLANGEILESKEVTAADNWSWNFTNLDKYADGAEITYTITEDPVEDYSTVIKGYNVTNSYTPGKTAVSGSKTWMDTDNQDGVRPDSITINLLANGKKVDSKVVTAADNWSWSFEDLDQKQDGKDIVYTITEDAVPGYKAEVNGYNVTNTHENETTSVSGSKTWVDSNDQDGARPDHITIHLLANGTKVDSKEVTAADGWNFSFTDLDKYADGKAIEYTITEDAVEGYDAAVNGYDVTNTHKTETTEVSGTKTWSDADNQDGKRPESVTINLFANDVLTDTQVVKADAQGNWTYKFTNLPKYADGKAIVYTVSEDKVADYSTTYDGYNVTNTYTPDQTAVSGSKTWADNDNQDGIRPTSITVKLLANGKEVDSKVVTAKDNWSWTFDNLDTYANGKEIVYTIAEDAVKGYDTTVNGYNVTNTHETEKVNVSGSKTWKDAEDQDGIRPESITIHLLANGEKAASKVVTASDAWRFSFTDLDKYADGKEIVYTITEESVKGYETVVSGYNVTNTHESETTEVSGTKTWDDSDNQDGKRPESITVNLFANGEKVDSKTVTARTNWTYHFTDLPKYEKGELIEYTITESKVAGYSTTYDGYDITNSYTPGKTAVSGSKTWLDNKDQDKLRPESVTINLLANGEVVDSQIVTAANGWSYSFTDLDEYANGQKIDYTISEEPVKGYTATYKGYNVINTHETETTSVSGSKTWADNNDQDGVRPESITINLYANGEKVANKVVTASDNWSWSFTDLDKYADGKAIIYTISEEAVKGYDTVVSGYNVTNTHETEKTSVSGSKTWADHNDQDGKRPESIVINLLANGTKVDSQTVTAADNWSYNFTDLDKYEDGKEIAYTITEDAVDGYSVAYKGYNVINSYTPDKTAVSGSKTWADNNDQDGVRPTSITITLYADGVEAASKVVTAADGWRWTFADLDKYAEGKEITYTIAEEAVDGYTAVVNGYNVTNTHETETTEVSGSKTWADNDDQDGIRPSSIKINLLANGQKVASKVVTAADNWSYSFTDLAKYADGKEITYTITEDAVDGYTAKVTGYDVTNTHKQELTDITGSKFWDDAEDQDGKRPTSITINLFADGQYVDSQIVKANADGNWTYKFTNLPKYADGKEIAYTVTEDAVADYSTTYDGLTVTNTYTPDKTAVSGSKTWVDHNDQDGKRPASIAISLHANGKVIATKNVTAADNWSWSFEDLDKYENGKEIVYTISEAEVEGYTSEINGFNAINTHETEKTQISGGKTWKDANDQDGKRPTSITINLLANGKQVDRKVVTASENWNWSFENLDKYADGKLIVYSITEDEVTDYTATVEGYNVTNTHKPETVEISGNKSWDDADDQDGKRPESVIINLFADGQQIDTATVTAKDGWAYSFKDLPAYDNGKRIAYTITESPVAEYSTTYDGYNVINSYTPGKVAVSGSKTWDDADDQDGIRPGSIAISLLANGKVVATKTVTAADNWSWSFEDLDEYSAGKLINYTVEEAAIDGYDTTVNGYNIVNTHTPETTAVSGTKTWQDADDQDGARPDHIIITLYGNGEKVASAIVTAADNWTWNFTDLAKYADGKEIQYTITEDAVDGYKSAVTGYDVTNTHETEKTSVSGSKTWADNNDQDGKRPANITINLLANGEKVDSKVVTAADNWSYSFTDLDKYADGKEIAYTITEDAVADYTTTVNGYDVTNTHDIEKVSVSGSKIWKDSDNQDGKRPAFITINLFADGKYVDTQTVKPNAEGQWNYEFKNLDKYADGQEITYTVTEEAVKDYSVTYDGLTVTNTHTPGKVAVSGSKIWKDNDDQDGKRPESITINLLADGHIVDSKEVTARDNWSFSFENLDEYKAGEKITYTITENPVAGYETEISDYNVINTHEIEKTEVSGTKTWIDNDDQDGKRPESITINLYANGDKVASQTVTAADNWSYSFTDLDKYAAGKEIRYTIDEEPVEGYETEVNGYDVTNTHEIEKTEVSGIKTWKDADDQDGLRPESITITLLANGKKVDRITVTAEDDWSFSFTDLDKYENGKEIQYTITEKAVEGYETEILPIETAELNPEDFQYEVINTHETETVDVSGIKTWNDGNNQDGKRPESITIRLYADGEVVDAKVVTEKDNWNWNFAGLAKYRDQGVEILYTITEDAVKDYTTTVTGYDVENTYAPEKTTVSVTKTWDDQDDADGIRPGQITIVLFADGVDTGKRLILNDANNWTGTFTDLDEYADGKHIEYMVYEEKVDGYKGTVSGDAKTGFIIKNIHKVKTPPTPPTTDKTSGGTGGPGGNTKVKTGDSQNPAMWAILMGICAAALSGCGVAGRRKQGHK